MVDNNETINLKLLGYQSIEGTVICETGLHIGAAAETSEIMGLDNPIIKHPRTKEAYIPGSSIKGKMRTLLELDHGKVRKDGRPHNCGPNKDAAECRICRVFGVGGDSKCAFGPGRLLVRDAHINDTVVDKKLTELKWENTINRASGTAVNPRQTERVPAGTEFTFRLDYRVFDTGDGGATDKKFFAWVLYGLKLIEEDYLGGSGSRGYGRVSFGTVKVTPYDNSEQPKDVNIAHDVTRPEH